MQLDQQKLTLYNSHFEQQCEEIRGGPKQKRVITDGWCLGVFLLLFISFVVITIYFLSQGGGYLKDMSNGLGNSNTKQLGQIFGKTIPQVIGMIFLSISLSIIFIILCSRFPKCVMYTCIVGTILIYIGLIIVGIVMKSYALSIAFGIILFVNLLILYCYRDRIQVGISLIKISGDFLLQKPGIYFISLISLALNLLFQLLWILGHLSGASMTMRSNNTDQSSRSIFLNLLTYYYCLGIFFGLFLYYCFVFVVSTAASNWFYQRQGNVLSGFLTLRYHLGSITFGAVVVTVLTILRILANKGKNSKSGVISIIVCIVACIISCIQDLIRFLNHNAIIVMSVTGQGYIDSAKSAISLIFQNYGVFIMVDFFNNFLAFYSTIICVLIPSFLGGYLIYVIQNDITAAILGGILIFILSWIVSAVILGMLYEVISCIFVFYCLEKKFQIIGGGQYPRCNPQIRRAFDGSFDQGNYNQNQRNHPHLHNNGNGNDGGNGNYNNNKNNSHNHNTGLMNSSEQELQMGNLHYQNRRHNNHN